MRGAEEPTNSFGGSYAQAKHSRIDEALVIVFLPALAITLRGMESRKGSALSEDEVISIRDEAACIAMLPEDRDQLQLYRDWSDIDPENVWADWKARRDLSDEEFF